MSPLSVTEAPLLLDFIDAVATAFVLDAAAQLGVINPVVRRSQDTSQLVDACATDPSMTALLLERFASFRRRHQVPISTVTVEHGPRSISS